MSVTQSAQRITCYGSVACDRGKPWNKNLMAARWAAEGGPEHRRKAGSTPNVSKFIGQIRIMTRSHLQTNIL